ncbi:MAG: hypothetical protein ACMUIG_08225 [Thermoplasmatota archaeon]
MSVRVRKEDGTVEKFQRSKIVESLETMGLDHKTAKRIAKEVHEHDWISEHEIKVKVFGKLDQIDSRIADEYFSTHKVHVKSETMQMEGNVLIPDNLMDLLEIRVGDKMDMIHHEKHAVLRAYRIGAAKNDHDFIYMSEKDMRKMNIRNKDQVAICKHVEHIEKQADSLGF